MLLASTLQKLSLSIAMETTTKQLDISKCQHNGGEELQGKFKKQQQNK